MSATTVISWLEPREITSRGTARRAEASARFVRSLRSSALRGGRGRLRAQQKLLHSPVRGLGGVNLVLRRARQLVDARKLAELTSGTANYAQHLALERHLEQAAGVGAFADEEHLIRTWRDADRVGCTNHGRQAGPGWRVAIDRSRAGRWRDIDGEHPEELALRVEDLNAPIRSV